MGTTSVTSLPAPAPSFLGQDACLAVLGLAAASYAHPTAEATHAEEWKHFKIAHNKNYESPVEDSFRMKIFIENKIKISVHNELFAQGKTSYTMKMNRFGDMLPHEIIGNGLLPEIRGHGKTAKHAPSVKTPSSRDWRDGGVVTAVKDQGGCGSCWAFSTVGTVEGAHAQHSGKLVSLSEQQLVDCDNNNYGCGGGWMTVALDYVVKKALESERSYPYQAVQLRCKYDESQVAADDITSYVEIATGDEDGLEDAVGNQRPVSVAVNANNNWFYY